MKANVTLSAWRKRAARLFPLEGKDCERCGTVKALGRHHMDFDPTNNGKRNLRALRVLPYQMALGARQAPLEPKSRYGITKGA